MFREVIKQIFKLELYLNFAQKSKKKSTVCVVKQYNLSPIGFVTLYSLVGHTILEVALLVLIYH